MSPDPRTTVAQVATEPLRAAASLRAGERPVITRVPCGPPDAGFELGPSPAPVRHAGWLSLALLLLVVAFVASGLALFGGTSPCAPQLSCAAAPPR